MSFDYNPYLHIELVRSSRGLVVHCHSCGGDMAIDEHARISDAFETAARHVRVSHERSRSDFEGWSAY